MCDTTRQRCGMAQRAGFSDYQCIYTRASTNDTSRRFFPSTGQPRLASSIKAVRCQADVYNMTGDCYIQFAYQESDDPDNWPSADVANCTVIGATTITTDGILAGTSFEALTLTKAYVRFGVVIRNNNAGSPKYELVWVATRFDTRTF